MLKYLKGSYMPDHQTEMIQCPKCNSILTETDKLSGECPVCLIVFEKYAKVQAAKLARAGESKNEPEEDAGKEACLISIHNVLRKIGVYEFVIKLAGLIGLTVCIYGAFYAYFITFEPGKDDSSQSNKAIVKQPSVASVKDNFGACLTKDLLNQLFDAHHNNDGRAIAWLMENGCVVTKKDWKISVIDRGILKSKIRVYTEYGTAALWVDSGCLK